ncbi:MAG: acetolactate synthase large subunit [Pseudomonadota bacterium]
MSATNAPNGADALIATLLHNGVDTCFSNPGTSEMHFVAALDNEPCMRCVLGLFEGGVTGAADGYARMAGKPACTLLHLGPGLANGLANLHNARRAHSPIVNVIGEHATYHRALDAPLTADIEGFAAPVSSWIRTCESADEIAATGAEAIAAAMAPPGQIASLILPADTAWSPAATQAPVTAEVGSLRQPAADIDALAAILRSDAPTALLVNGNAVIGANLMRLGELAARTGATLIGDTFIARIERGAGRPGIRRLPYFAEQAIETLSAFEHLILVDTKAPVSFFAYPGVPSELTPASCQCHTLTAPGEDTAAALLALLDAVGGSAPAAVPELERPALPQGALNPQSIAQALAHLMPEQAIIVNEAATGGFGIPGATAAAAPHDWLDLTGGAIGMGIPAATGAAIACPDRRVIDLQADGSGMYTLQALWTQAREQLDVTTIIFANRKYAILQVEFMRVGAHNPGRRAMDMMELDRPNLDWVALAAGMGVPGTQASSAGALSSALEHSLATPGPYLIEAVL